jgi:hypothetical protein
MLLGYHYALRQQAKQLAKERIEIQKRKDSAIAASDAAHKARSDASYTNVLASFFKSPSGTSAFFLGHNPMKIRVSTLLANSKIS